MKTTGRDLPFERAFRQWLGENEMRWEELKLPVSEANGRSTAYRISPAGKTTRIVCCFHGAGNDSLFGWVGLFKKLLRTETEIFTFDLPGHGRHDTTRFGAADIGVAVEAAIEECRRDRDSIPVHALGVSLGGSVLLSALDRVQDRLTTACLVVAPLRIVLDLRSVLSEIGWRTLRLLWRERQHYGFTGLIPSFGPFKRDVYPLRLLVEPGTGPFDYVDTLNAELAAMRLEAAARRVRVPVLLVYGDRDRVVPLEQGERLARALPNSELVRIRYGSHLSTPLESPTIDCLLRWLEVRG